MNRLKQTRNWMVEKLPWFVLISVILQPMMDSLSYWITELGWSNAPTLLLRFGLLGLTALLGFCLSRRKWVYWTAAGVFALLGAGHIYAVCSYGATNLVGDLTNYIRVLQLPITVICLITFLRENEDCYKALKWGMVGSLAIILVVELLAVLTGTDPHTYVDGKGVLGWFNNTNAQSNILCILVPVVVVWIYEKKGVRSPWFWMTMLVSFGALFLLGTRLGLLGLLAAGFGLGISVILVKPSQWKRALCFVGACALFVALLPVSPMTSHQDTFSHVQENRQKIVDDRLAMYDLKPLDEEGISQEELEARQAQWVEALSYTYNFHAHDFVEIFGLERTIAHYNYSSDIGEITAQRPKKLLFGDLLMEDSGLPGKLFGVELQRFTVGRNNYDVENDLHGIYYLYGVVGLAAMGLFLAYFAWLIVKALCKNFKRYFTMDAAGWGIAFLCALVHIALTAGVLRRPNSSFYLAAVLAAIYYLVNVKQYPIEEKK